MDNKKIGELIAKQRKEKGLTQQELGDKVGVGSRAVSKWECGTTVPDISIINELSEILGISSNELLAGKLNPQTKFNSKAKLLKTFLIIFLSLIICITPIISLIIYNNNKTYTYNLTAEEYDKYKISGNITYKNGEANLFIKKFSFNTNEPAKLTIKNYQYNIYLEDKLIFGYNQNENDIKSHQFYNVIDIEKSIENSSHFKILDISLKELLAKNIHITLSVIDDHNYEYNYDIKIITYKSNN